MIWSIVASAVAALGGAWAGAHFALRRFKRERAHEERLAWYLDTVDALKEAEFAFAEVILAFAGDKPHEEVVRRIEVAVEKMMNALTKTHQSRIFASQSTAEAIEEGKQTIRNWEPLDAQNTKREDLIEGIPRFRDLFRDLARAVSDDARDHLGLEPIET